RHTRFSRDWSSDVVLFRSLDPTSPPQRRRAGGLGGHVGEAGGGAAVEDAPRVADGVGEVELDAGILAHPEAEVGGERPAARGPSSEERRGGKERTGRGSRR